MKRYVLLLMLVMSIQLVLATTDTTWKTYNNPQYGFSIQYPGDWEVQINEDALFTVTKLDEEMPVVFMVLADTLKEVKNSINREEEIDQEIASLTEMLEEQGLTDLEVIQRADTLLNEQPAYQITFRVSVLGLIFLKWDNLIVSSGNNEIYFICYAEESSFEDYTSIFEQIKHSIRF
jgi:hypothetical protein